jgi:hypothetical protein
LYCVFGFPLGAVMAPPLHAQALLRDADVADPALNSQELSDFRKADYVQ